MAGKVCAVHGCLTDGLFNARWAEFGGSALGGLTPFVADASGRGDLRPAVHFELGRDQHTGPANFHQTVVFAKVKAQVRDFMRRLLERCGEKKAFWQLPEVECRVVSNGRMR